MNPDLDKIPSMDEPDPSRIELLLQRSRDGELRPSEREELRRALEEDASLRQLQRRGDLQAEFFQADRKHDQSPPLALDFADRVLARLSEPFPTSGLPGPSDEAMATPAMAPSDEPLRLGPWILAAAILLGVLLVGQFLTRPDEGEFMRAGTREAQNILRELDRSSEARSAGQPLPTVPGADKR